MKVYKLEKIVKKNQKQSKYWKGKNTIYKKMKNNSEKFVKI